MQILEFFKKYEDWVFLVVSFLILGTSGVLFFVTPLARSANDAKRIGNDVGNKSKPYNVEVMTIMSWVLLACGILLASFYVFRNYRDIIA